MTRKAIALVILTVATSYFSAGCHALAGAGHDLTRIAKFSQRAIDSQVWDPQQEAR